MEYRHAAGGKARRRTGSRQSRQGVVPDLPLLRSTWTALREDLETFGHRGGQVARASPRSTLAAPFPAIMRGKSDPTSYALPLSATRCRLPLQIVGCPRRQPSAFSWSADHRRSTMRSASEAPRRSVVATTLRDRRRARRDTSSTRASRVDEQESQLTLPSQGSRRR